MRTIDDSAINRIYHAKTIMSILEDDYSMFNTNSPDEKNRTNFYNRCGEIYALIVSAKEDIDCLYKQFAN